MALSATLKLGQTWKSMKSTTAPRPGPGLRSSRSTRLPLAPPSSSPRLTAQPRLPSRRDTRRMTTTTVTAMAVNSSVAPSAKENAAPGLRLTRISSCPPSSSSVRRPSSSATTSTLVATSSASTASGDQRRAAPCARRTPVGLGQRRSSRCLHVTHSVARGKACRRALGIGVAALLAPAVGAGVEPAERALDLHQQVAAVVGQRHLVLALEGLGAGVGLVARALAALVALELLAGGLGAVDLAAQRGGLRLELGAHLGQLVGRPVVGRRRRPARPVLVAFFAVAMAAPRRRRPSAHARVGMITAAGRIRDRA